MGPRQDAGEDTELPPTKVTVGGPLQWGPGRMPGKTNHMHGGEGEYASASMGPRQDAGEDASRRPEATDTPEASMGPRQDAGEDVYSISSPSLYASLLQWGPGRMPGKTR